MQWLEKDIKNHNPTTYNSQSSNEKSVTISQFQSEHSFGSLNREITRQERMLYLLSLFSFVKLSWST